MKLPLETTLPFIDAHSISRARASNLVRMSDGSIMVIAYVWHESGIMVLKDLHGIYHEYCMITGIAITQRDRERFQGLSHWECPEFALKVLSTPEFVAETLYDTKLPKTDSFDRQRMIDQLSDNKYRRMRLQSEMYVQRNELLPLSQGIFGEPNKSSDDSPQAPYTTKNTTTSAKPKLEMSEFDEFMKMAEQIFGGGDKKK